MAQASPILVIAGSVRPRRVAIHISDWVAAIGRDTTGCNLEVIDLKHWPLPMDDEAEMPQTGGYTAAHSLAWSKKIEAALAIVFVTPQYNWGYPAVLKNAIDHLYREWRGKPAMIVSYGGHGGGKCAAQLQQVLSAIGMAPIISGPALTLPRDVIESNLGEIDPESVFADRGDELRAAFAELKLALTPSQ